MIIKFIKHNYRSEYTPLYRNDPGNASDSSKPTSANNDINNNDKTLNHHSNSEPILSKPEPIAPSVDKFKDIPEAPILEAINERLNQSAYVFLSQFEVYFFKKLKLMFFSKVIVILMMSHRQRVRHRRVTAVKVVRLAMNVRNLRRLRHLEQI